MKVEEVLDILEGLFPAPRSELIYKNKFQLLAAVILSAQTTDVQVNKVTTKLFSKYPSPYEMAEAKIEDLMDLLKTIGLYKNKSNFLIGTSKKIIRDFNGQVPSTREELMTLPGVGRKTANVVLAEGFKIPALAVDTHVERVTKRLGWAEPEDSVLVVEEKLMKIIPKERWARAHHQILLFGRYHSTARNKEDIYDLLEKFK